MSSYFVTLTRTVTVDQYFVLEVEARDEASILQRPGDFVGLAVANSKWRPVHDSQVATKPKIVDVAPTNFALNLDDLGGD